MGRFACDDAEWTPVEITGDVDWAVDGAPAAPGALSPACSLNFNNGVDYASEEGASAGAVTSPVIDVSGVDTVWLSYYDFWEMEPLSSGYDQRELRLSTDGQTWNALPTGHGDDNNQWVWRKIELSALAGHQLLVRFHFDSVDDSYNDGAGWFVDELRLTTSEPFLPDEVCLLVAVQVANCSGPIPEHTWHHAAFALDANTSRLDPRPPGRGQDRSPTMVPFWERSPILGLAVGLLGRWCPLYD